MSDWLAGRVWFYKIEGMPCLNGLNFYPDHDPRSSGFVLKLGALHFKYRYSKQTKKTIVKTYWHKETYEEIIDMKGKK
jgi:hypothetical protein